jgi:hypothetical protein
MFRVRGALAISLTLLACVRVTRDGDHSFRGIVISRFAGRDHLFRAS